MSIYITYIPIYITNIMIPILYTNLYSNISSIDCYYNSLQEELENGEEVAKCPSCSLIIKVIYDPVSFDRSTFI